MQTWPVLSIFLSPAWRPPAAQGPPPLLHLQVPTGAFKAAWKTGEQTQVCVPLDGNLHAPLHPSQCALSTHLDTPQTHARIQMLTHSSHIHSVRRHITQKGSHTLTKPHTQVNPENDSCTHMYRHAHGFTQAHAYIRGHRHFTDTASHIHEDSSSHKDTCPQRETLTGTYTKMLTLMNTPSYTGT